MGPSASPQLLRNLRELFRIELGFATRPPRTPQGTSTTTPPISIPSTDTLATHPQLARNGGKDQLAGSKQPPRAVASLHHPSKISTRSEEHTSELQSRFDLVCRLLLEKK